MEVQPVIMPFDKLEIFQNKLMLFFTGLSRTASEIAADWIKNTPKNGRELYRMMHMVDEALEILGGSDSDLDDFGRLLHDAWQLKKNLADSISTEIVDEIYDTARKAGALGGKLLGAGGGGFILFYVPEEKQENVKLKLKNLLHVPFRFENFGSRIIYHAEDREYAPITAKT